MEGDEVLAFGRMRSATEPKRGFKSDSERELDAMRAGETRTHTPRRWASSVEPVSFTVQDDAVLMQRDVEGVKVNLPDAKRRVARMADQLVAAGGIQPLLAPHDYGLNAIHALYTSLGDAANDVVGTAKAVYPFEAVLTPELALALVTCGFGCHEPTSGHDASNMSFDGLTMLVMDVELQLPEDDDETLNETWLHSAAVRDG